ncbi:MAG: DUF2508 family protein [bacterium]|nr:DUF2508 family protein [bacterium]
MKPTELLDEIAQLRSELAAARKTVEAQRDEIEQVRAMLAAAQAIIEAVRGIVSDADHAPGWELLNQLRALLEGGGDE